MDILEKQEIEGMIGHYLENDFHRAIVISPDKKILRKGKVLIFGKIPHKNRGMVLFFGLDEFFGFLAGDDSEQDRAAGYKVKVRHRRLTESEEKERRKAILKIILGSLRK